MANKPTIKSFYADSGTIGDGITDANVITLSGTADANSTVNVYDGSTLLGSAKTNGSGIWLFETPKLSDSAHSLTATATDASGTSAASVAMSVTVVPSVTDFRSASDNWQNPIKIDGQGWYIESPNKAWSVTNPDPHTVRMEVRPGDEWADDGTARSEILTVTNAEDHQVFNASYTMTIEPGQINNVAWLSLTQMHEDEGIPFSIQLVGDHMTVLTDQNADWGTLAYSDPNAIVRGHAYDIQIRANFSTDSTGFLQIWRDGVQIVDYHGKLGSETGGQYLKLGIYEGWPENVSSPTAVDYSNIVVQYNNPNVATPSAPGNTTPPPVTTPPTTPAIANFSTDSGVAGDRITNDSTLTLMGTATANSTIKVFDGSTQVGTATADANGAWSLTTSTLANGGHSLTATATNYGGTSSASTALSVTIDTAAPSAPTIAASAPTSTDVEVLTGAAEANSTVKIFDGTTQIGTATGNGSGAWTYTTSPLSAGSHSFTAKAMDVAGNTGAASAAAAVTIPQGPAAPTIAKFSDDSGVAGDRITNDNTLTLTGTAAANSTVKVFDGSTQIGTANANSNGQWTCTTQALSDGGHNLTATATDAARHASAASAVLAVTIDTHAPVAPTMSVYSQAGSAVGSTTTLDDLVLKGTAEANSTIKVFDGSTQIGTATTNGSGTWSFDSGHLDAGSHSFTSTAVDAAGNIGFASASANVGITSPPPSAVPTTPAITPIAITAPSGSSNPDGRAGNDKITFKLTDATVSFAGSGDFNADGTSDILWRNVGTGQVDQWQMKDGNWSKSIDLGATKGADWQLTGVGDFNGDGTTDVLWQNISTSQVDQWQMKNGNWSKSIDLGTTKGAQWSLAGVGDFNADGTSDVLWRNISTGQVDQWQMKNGNWSKSIDLGATKGADWQLAGVGDFNGDGTTDVLWRNLSTGQVDEWQMKNGNWAKSIDLGATKGQDWTISGIGDANGDHVSDIFWFNTKTGQSEHWLMANGNWAGSIDDGTQSTALKPMGVGDFNHDGTSEALFGDPLAHFVQISQPTAQTFSQEIDGSTGNDILKGTSGDDVFVGNGGQDTFVFAANFGHDVIEDFAASGKTTYDVVQFSQTVFDSFASVLSHATQLDSDVLISAGSDTLLLKNTKLSALDSSDFRFA